MFTKSVKRQVLDARYRNYEAFRRHVEDSGGILYTTEIVYGRQHFEVTEPGDPQHLQLRCDQEPWRYEGWLKESSLNLLLNRLPHEAQEIGWVDSDVHFMRTDWCQETLNLLQRYDFLQMFSHTQDLGPDSEPLGQSEGYVASRKDGKGLALHLEKYYGAYYGPQGVMWLHWTLFRMSVAASPSVK